MATATVQLSIILQLDGRDVGLVVSSTTNDITQYRNAKILLPFAAPVEVLGGNFPAAIPALGALGNIRMLVVINRDAVNFMRLRVNAAGGQTMDIPIPPGMPFLLIEKSSGDNIEASVNLVEAAFAAFVDMDEIQAQADTADLLAEFHIYGA